MSCIVLDSPFSNLKKILVDIIKKYKVFPKAVAEYGYRKLKEQVWKRMSFDIEDINPMQAAAVCRVPAIFIHGTNDKLVNISHSKNLISVFAGQSKELLEVENSDHNTGRPQWIYRKVFKFLKTFLIEMEFNDHS